jgi:pentalenene oxygenase
MPDSTLRATARPGRPRKGPGPIALAPGAVPGLGHAHRLLHDPLGWLGECREAGPVVRVRLGPRTAYLVCDPDLVHQVLIDPSFDKGGALISSARELVGNGLATCPREDHRRQRRLMQPAFTQPRIDGYTTVMREEAVRLAESWTPHREVDLMADLSTTALRIVIRTMLPTTDAQEIARLAPQVRILMDGAFFRATVPFRGFFRLPTPGNRRFDRARREVFAAAERIVAAAREQPEAGGLLAVLIGQGDGQGDGHGHGHGEGDDAFTDRDLRDQVVTLLAAGSDTTATTLTWLFHLLAVNPAAGERVYEELDTVLGGTVAGPGDISKLPYTRNALLEALRLYPPVWMMSRITLSEVDLGGHQLPADAEILFSADLLHHDPEAFPEPHAFDPDRWDGEARPERHSYIPFHTGSRKCLGDNFTLTEAAVILSAVAAAWRLSPTPRHRPRPRPPLTMTPAGLHLVAEPRRGPVPA